MKGMLAAALLVLIFCFVFGLPFTLVVKHSGAAPDTITIKHPIQWGDK